jgi:hypothetical protein
MSDTPQVLLAHHLKALKLPTFLREYDKLARQCAAEGVDHSRCLLRLTELEIIDRERRTVERRIKEARFPAVKSLDSFDFTATPSLNKTLVLELARARSTWPAARTSSRWATAAQDSHRARTRTGRLPEGPCGRLHHRRRPGQRAARSPRRKASAAPAAPARRL